MLTHMRCSPVHDFLNRQFCHEIIAQFMHKLMEFRFGIEERCLFIKECEHILLQFGVSGTKLRQHRHELLLHEFGCIFQIDKIHGLSQSCQEECQRTLRLFPLILLQQSLNGSCRSWLHGLLPEIGCDFCQELLVPAARLKPLPDMGKEFFRFHRAQMCADALSKFRGFLLAVLAEQEAPRIMVKMMRYLRPCIRLAEPFHEHRHQVKAFQMMEHLAAREEFFLYHRHRSLDEGLTTAWQYGRMIREAQRLAEECRDGKPVGNATHKRRFRTEQETGCCRRSRPLQMKIQGQQEEQERKKQYPIRLVPGFYILDHAPHTLSATQTRR